MIKKQNRRELFNSGRFFASDFVTFGMFKGAVGATVAYALIVLVAFLSQADDLLSEIRVSDLIDMAIRYIQIYILMLVVVILLSAVIHYRIYRKSAKCTRRYRKVIKELDEIIE